MKASALAFDVMMIVEGDSKFRNRVSVNGSCQPTYLSFLIKIKKEKLITSKNKTLPGQTFEYSNYFSSFFDAVVGFCFVF